MATPEQGIRMGQGGGRRGRFAQGRKQVHMVPRWAQRWGRHVGVRTGTRRTGQEMRSVRRSTTTTDGKEEGIKEARSARKQVEGERATAKRTFPFTTALRCHGRLPNFLWGGSPTPTRASSREMAHCLRWYASSAPLMPPCCPWHRMRV